MMVCVMFASLPYEAKHRTRARRWDNPLAYSWIGEPLDLGTDALNDDRQLLDDLFVAHVCLRDSVLITTLRSGRGITSLGAGRLRLPLSASCARYDHIFEPPK